MQIEVKFTQTEVKEIIRAKLLEKYLKASIHDIAINSDGSVTAKCAETYQHSSSSYYDR